MTDWTQYLERAGEDRKRANETYTKALHASELAAFAELVFTAAEIGALTLTIEPSDQGPYMTLLTATYADDNVDTDGFEDDTWDPLSDLRDDRSAYWADLPGVTWDERGLRATIDVQVAISNEGLRALGYTPISEEHR